jgi:hypothetical protein
MDPDDAAATDADVLRDIERWLDRAVIGLNLCPFAKAVRARGQIRFVVSAARDTDALHADLVEALQHLAATPPDEVDTTLLIHPRVLGDFLDFNDFLDVADATVDALGLAGVIQVASFHPDYRFADSEPGDIANASNRAPHPVLHLLREASIDRAVAAFPDAADIYERNIDTLRRLGHAGWARLFDDPPQPADGPPCAA